MELAQSFESSMQDAMNLQCSLNVPQMGLDNAVITQQAKLYQCEGQINLTTVSTKAIL